MKCLAYFVLFIGFAIAREVNYEYLQLGDDELARKLASVTEPEGVRRLILNGNLLTKIPDLSRFKETIDLNLSGNLIDSLPIDVFNCLPNLRNLYLGYNQIALITVGTFNGLNSLEILYLSHNLISRIQLGAFTGLSEIKHIYLRKNPLKSLEFGVFNGLYNVGKVHL
jgi:Leucine-rich repeat (LRR) protein